MSITGADNIAFRILSLGGTDVDQGVEIGGLDGIAGGINPGFSTVKPKVAVIATNIGSGACNSIADHNISNG